MRKTRMLAIAWAVAAVLAAGCSDDADDASDPDETTTTVDDATTQELRHDSLEPAAEFCDAIATHDGAEVVALMSDDAVAVDHSTGAVYVGPDEIRAWIDEFGGFDTFELTECGTEGVASNWWSAGPYRFYSDTNDGGTEGLGVAQMTDGKISRFDAIYTLSTGETNVSDPISEEDRATATAFCEAWGTEDPEQILPLVSADYSQQAAALVPSEGTVVLREPFPAGEAGVPRGCRSARLRPDGLRRMLRRDGQQWRLDRPFGSLRGYRQRHR